MEPNFRKLVEGFLYEDFKDRVDTVHWHDKYVEITLKNLSLHQIWHFWPHQAKEIATPLYYLFCINYISVNVFGSFNNMFTYYFIKNIYCGLNQQFFQFYLRNFADGDHEAIDDGFRKRFVL